MEKEIYEVYRKQGVRLTAEMSPLIYKFYYAPTGGRIDKGWHMFDKAHAVMLTEEDIIPKEAGINILEALRQMEEEGISKVREALGGHAHCGEAYISKVKGPEIGGWIHCGRSSGDLFGVGWRVAARDAIIAVMKELINIRRTFLKKAEEHIDTVMPGYTHLQHAEPITFGFYLLSWVHQLERDFERSQGAYKHTNISPAGCAVLTTTDFPINRERTRELLGFDDIYTNARDAIWSTDFLLEILSALAGTTGVLSRLADDLTLWHSSEFGMVELPDTYCGTSSIMPQKKNPYGTECIRGLYGDVIGFLVAFLSITKAHSDACEMSTMAPCALNEVVERCLASLQIMNGMMKDLKINKEVMKKRAGMFWTQAATLANMIVREKKIPFRSAHQIVGILVRIAYSEGKQPQDVTSEMLNRAAMEFNGRPLHLSEKAIQRAMDPEIIVKSKNVIGGTPPERLQEDIASSFKRVKKDEGILEAIETKLTAAEKKLETAIDKILGEEVKV